MAGVQPSTHGRSWVSTEAGHLATKWATSRKDGSGHSGRPHSPKLRTLGAYDQLDVAVENLEQAEHLIE